MPSSEPGSFIDLSRTKTNLMTKFDKEARLPSSTTNLIANYNSSSSAASQGRKQLQNSRYVVVDDSEDDEK